MDFFHPAIRAWFQRSFATPSPIQIEGWPAIRDGGDVLLSAPTGSGKTLAAFLWSIDRLLQDDVPDGVRILYVSPLKALGNDIERNLRTPLREIVAEAGLERPLRVAVRSGDSLPADRQRLVRRPPHILVTTPESLYLLLTARRSRAILRTVETVIVDEIHALAPNRRGAHLALSLVRLDRLCGRRVQRIGLSATQRPLPRIAGFLSGTAPCRIVETPLQRPRRLDVFCPAKPLGAVTSQDLWDAIVDRLAHIVEAHRTTLVFTHTRRLAERLARWLGERLGPDAVASHHGSLSRDRRLQAEQRLKGGELKALVATASLELGIDVGHVDVVCHVGAPRSIGGLLQRVGRSGRTLERDSVGVLFPLTRDDLVQCAAAVRAVHQGVIDEIDVPPGAHDVLSQHVAAWVAGEDDGVAIDDVLATVRQCSVYRILATDTFYRLIDTMTEGRRPLLYRDPLRQRLHGRPGTLTTALTGGGAIADTGDYEVLELPDETPVGRLNEDFAIESMVGDVFLLGSTSWRIRRLGTGKVYVDAAPGQSATVPFWLGEAPGRSRELSQAVSDLRRDVVARHPVEATGLDAEGSHQLEAYLTEGAASLPAVPTSTCFVAERFFDDSGGMQLVIHAPLGMRMTRAWGLALRKRFCVTFDFELQAAATDNGLLISLSRRHSFELASVFNYVHPASMRADLVQAVLQAPVFGQYWRATAARALMLPRTRGGRKIPVPVLRMKAEDLLASVFPAQVMCQDNRSGPVEPPDHPLVSETLHDCLEGWMDEPGMRRVVEALRGGRIECHAVDTVAPSPFAHEILHAMPYAFLDDAPLEERRARAVSTWGPTDVPRLDAGVVRRVAEDAWPRPTDVHGLHHLLTRLGWVAADELRDQAHLLPALLADGRAVRRDAHGMPGYAPSQAIDTDAAIEGWMECLGPVTARDLVRRTGLPLEPIEHGLLALEARGLVLRGQFTGTSVEWCHRDRLDRMHRETLRQRRAAVEPVPVRRWAEFVEAWQVRDGVDATVAQLQGLELTPDEWSTVLAGRLAELELRCLSGDLGWARLTAVAPEPALMAVGSPFVRPSSTPHRRLTRVACFPREAWPWLAGPPHPPPSTRAAALLERLQQRGACFAHELGPDPGAVAELLDELAALGHAASDGLGPWQGQFRGRWFAWDATRAPADVRIERWARLLLNRYGVVFRDLLEHEPGAPAWTPLRRAWQAMELAGTALAGRFVATVPGEQFASREAVTALRHPTGTHAALTDADPIRKVTRAIGVK